MWRKLYQWTMAWSGSPKAVPALFWISFIEASVFPIPPYLLLIPMVLANPQRGWHFAFWGTLGSVLGGVSGYIIGWQFWDVIGRPMMEQSGRMELYEGLRQQFDRYDAWIILMTALSPIPYKVFTLTAGVMQASLPLFIFASLVARSLRFFGMAMLVMWGGRPALAWLERHGRWITLVFLAVLLAIGAWILVK
ncbi:MAG: DedA family protein [Magnetococcales bacterium]|nr:DedA family protein [Magnetococcales bacterium]